MFLSLLRIWWPSLVTLAVVLYATLWPDPAGADEVMLFPGADKLIHAVMMGGLLSALLFDYRRSGKVFTRRGIVLTAVSVIIFSGVDEVAQQAMQLGRTLDVFDFLADAIGVVIAAFTAPPVINAIFSKKK